MPQRKRRTVRPPESAYFFGRLVRSHYITGGWNKALLEKEIRQRTIIPIERFPALKRKLRKQGYDTKNVILYPRGLEPRMYHIRSISTEPGTIREKEYVFKGASERLRHRKVKLEERSFWGGARLPTVNQATDVARKLWKEYAKARKERDPVLMEALRRGIKKAPFLEPIAIIEPLQYPFQFRGRSSKTRFVRKHKRALLPKEREMILTPEQALGGMTPKTFKIVRGSKISGIPLKFRRDEIVFNYAIDTNKRLQEFMISIIPKLKFPKRLKVEKSQEEVEKRIYPEYGIERVRKVRRLYKELLSTKTRAELLSDFVLNLAVSTHLIQNRLNGSGESGHGRVFDTLNVTMDGKLVDYDSIGLHEKVSEKKIKKERKHAKHLIGMYWATTGLSSRTYEKAIAYYDMLIKMGGEYIQAKRKRRKNR